MLANEYVFETNLNLDLEKLKKDIENSKSRSDLKPHQRLLEDSKYLIFLQKQIPILGSHWNIYDFRPGFLLDKHIDSARKATLNIPIFGGEDSITRFYENIFDEKILDESKKLFYIKENLKEKFSFTLKMPTVIRTDVPHSIQVGTQHRLIISWGLTCDFDTAKSYFKDLSVFV